jgi:hypothetical protein
MPTRREFDPTKVFRPLTACVKVFDDEPAHGLMARLARLNGAPTLQAFGGENRLPFEMVVRGQLNAPLAALAGTDVRGLDRTTFRRDGNLVRLGDEILQHDDFCFQGGLRVCPDCLRQDIEICEGRPEYRAHVRTWWNIAQVQVCPFHRVELIEHIPGTKLPLNSDALDVRRAAGPDFDLAKVPRGHMVSDVRVETYILGRLGFLPRKQVSILDEMPLWNAMRLMDRVGATVLGGPAGYTSVGGNVPPREALGVGFSILEEGEESFVRFLDSMIEFEGPTTRRHGYYGKLYIWLHKRTSDKIYDPVRDIIRQHMLDHLALKPGELVFGKAVEKRRFYAVNEVADKIGIRPETARKLMVAYGVGGPRIAEPLFRTVLSVEETERFHRTLDESFNYESARRYLNVSIVIMDRLLKADLFKSFVGSRDVRLFKKDVLDAFLDRLAGNASLTTVAPPNAYNIPEIKRKAMVKTSDVVTSLLTGKLHCAARLTTEAGFLQILVDLHEVRALYKNTTHPDNAVATLRRTLGLFDPVFKKLIELGYLRTEIGSGKFGNELLIDRKSLAEFQANFVSALELAKSLNTSSRSLQRVLATFEIFPVDGKSDENRDRIGKAYFRSTEVDWIPVDEIKRRSKKNGGEASLSKCLAAALNHESRPPR